MRGLNSNLPQQCFEFLLLLEGQARCRTGMRLGSQAVGRFCLFEPAIDGTFADAHDASHVGDRFAGLDGLNCLSSA